MVPSFRQLGERYFAVQLERQRGELDESLEAMESFAGLEHEERYAATNKAMMQVRHLLAQLGRIWHEVLPTGLYLRSIGVLVDHAARRVVADVVRLQGIPQTALSNLSDLVACLVEAARELLEGEGGKATEAVPCWPQLEALAGLLEVVQAPAHYVHGARRGQLAVLLTNLNLAFEDEEAQELVRRLVAFDNELALSLVQKMRELAAGGEGAR